MVAIIQNNYSGIENYVKVMEFVSMNAGNAVDYKAVLTLEKSIVCKLNSDHF